MWPLALPSLPAPWPLALSAALALAGLAGAATHASHLYSPLPPSPSSGSALNVLLAALTLAFALEAAWLHAGGAPLASGAYAARCRAASARLPLAAVPMLALLYVVGYRLDAAAWCVPLLGALLLQLAGLPAAAAPAAAAPKLGLLAEEGLQRYSVQSDGALLAEHGPPPPLPLPQPATRVALCRACCCPPAGTPAPLRLAFCLHGALWAAATAFLLLMLGGAGVTAAGWRRFGRRGTQYDLQPLGQRALLHAWCTGPPYNASRPTVWLDTGGGGHSMSDTFGLQFALNAAGWRTCTADPPGTAWSPLREPADQLDALAPARTRALMRASGERGPFVLLGTMDGGAERIYGLALQFPELVAALVPMQYGPPEFSGYAARAGLALDAPAVLAYAASQIASRAALCDAIRFVGVPWGLMPLLTPGSPRFVPQGLQDECHFLNLHHEGQWDMQCRVLAAQVRAPATIVRPSLWTSNRTLAGRIPVLAIGNFYSSGGVCAASGAAGEDCEVLRLNTALGLAFMRNMTTMTPRSAFVNGCANDASAVCKDWMGGGATVPFVASAVQAFLAGIGAA
jgi:hypothetical protein